jgi:RNA polymerase-binding protein DksA
MSTSIHSQAEDKLRAERARLVHQLEELGANESGELRGDVDFGDGFADAAAATAERTEVLGLIDSLHGTLVDVDAALARIDEGTYGTCARCGEEIGADRLEFRPASIYCVRCKSAG